MKIGMLCDTFLPVHGGGEIHVLELSRALRKMGNHIEICTPTPGDKTVDGFPVTRLPSLQGGQHKAIALLPAALPAIYNFLKRMDVVHCHYSYMFAFLGTVICKILRIPTVMTLHGLGTLDSSVRNSPISKTYRWVSMRLAGRVIATSDEMRDVARRYCPDDKIVIITNGTDTNAFKPQNCSKKSNDALIVLAMRRLNPKNGVQYLVEAAPFIIEQVPNAQFWIAGANKIESYLRNRVIELGVQEQFKFLGVVPYEKTAEHYAQADVVAFPSSAESTSLACLEAMAMEKAIVASALGPFKDMLGDNERGILVKLFDRESSDYNAPMTLPADRIALLAKAIIGLLLDEQLRKQLGQNARLFVIKNYDWKSIAERVLVAYEAAKI